MSNNFYKIKREQLIDEVFKENPNKIIVLFFTYYDANYDINIVNNVNKIKKHIKTNLSNEDNSIFLLIELQNFLISHNTYSSNISKNNLPIMRFYYNSENISEINNVNDILFIDMYNKIKEFIEFNNTNNEKNILIEQIQQQKKLEVIDKLKQEHIINELNKIKFIKTLESNK
jgi:hypothetical protein